MAAKSKLAISFARWTSWFALRLLRLILIVLFEVDRNFFFSFRYIFIFFHLLGKIIQIKCISRNSLYRISQVIFFMKFHFLVPFWCHKKEKALFLGLFQSMVRITEFESARVAPLTPEISASTSSAISALLSYNTPHSADCKVFFCKKIKKKQKAPVYEGIMNSCECRKQGGVSWKKRILHTD